jgi:YidC/Oxa1 family membrane protein insertase
MQRNTIYAIILSLGVVVLWDLWYYNRYKDVMEANRAKSTQKLHEAKTAPKQAATNENPSQTPALTQAEATKPLDLSAPAPTTVGKKIVVNTGTADIVVSTTGGTLDSYKLLKYRNGDGNPTEIIDDKLSPRPLSLEFATPEVSGKINSSIFTSDAPERVELSPQNPSATVPLTLTLENGVTITKALTFHYASYLIDLAVGVNGPGVAGSTFGIAWNGLGGEEGKSYSYVGPVVLIDDKRLADVAKEKEPQVHDGNIIWGGLTNKYYCAAFIPSGGKTKLTAYKYGEKDGVTLQLSSGAQNRLSLYAGPKDHDELNNTGHEFIRMINYGWFDILANPLFWFLTKINFFLGNFGWSIIVLTVGVKLLFWPLSQSSFKSVEKMKKVQPEMKMIQERYKSDRTKMNEELIALYKKYSINPMAGCLPIILQIPVFVALYKVLLESIDLKGAPFIFWIHDLATKDPYYVTPILMGISMFAQQKMSPSSSDPLQRKLMMAMPLVFTVMFINFPSGLVVYWLVNNLLSILQQYMLIMQNKEAK